MTETLRDKIRSFGEREKTLFLKSRNPFALLRKRTAFFDALISNMFDDQIAGLFDGRGVFIAAVGGYGRKELYPRSDIDIVVVHRDVAEERLKKIIEHIIVPLTDAKIEVGYSFRHVNDLPDDLDKDLVTVTSLLDARFVAGDYRLFDVWESDKLSVFIAKKRRAYVEKKTAEYRKRYSRFNQSPHILEPNIKEGIGGLREFHYMRWIGKVLFGSGNFENMHHLALIEKKELHILREAYRFLSTVRCYMHCFHYVQKEVLNFELQDELSRFLEYSESVSALAVERFMGDYYRFTHEVYLISSKLFHTFGLLLERRTAYTRRELDRGIYLEGFGGGEINLLSRTAGSSMRLILKSFLFAKKFGKAVSYKTRNYLSDLSGRISYSRWDDEVRSLFMQIISPAEAGAADVLMEMHHSGFIKALFPEFANIYHKMQFDSYHIYTVDIHSLVALRKLEEAFTVNSDGIREKVRNPGLLALAVLLHDIGKGEGRDHCEGGGEIVDAIARRMELDTGERDLLVFLVKKHLLLSHVAQRRDISDSEFLSNLYTEEIGDYERLAYLYFLTVADLMAVGEGVWSGWKERLLRTLFTNLERTAASEARRGALDEPVTRKRAELEAAGLSLPSGLIDALPDAYLLNTDTQIVLRDLQIDGRLFASPQPGFVLEIHPNEMERVSEVIVATKDRQGLFSQLAGALTLVGFNILSATINTRKNGNVLDVFFVDLGKREFEVDPYMHEKLDECLQAIIERNEKIDDKVAAKARRYHRKSYFRERNDVVFDNASSRTHTIVEVFAGDHMGLLFEITTSLSSLGLDIAFSRISTFGDRAVDVFYVQKNGGKIQDERELEHVRGSLLRAITHRLS